MKKNELNAWLETTLLASCTIVIVCLLVFGAVISIGTLLEDEPISYEPVPSYGVRDTATIFAHRTPPPLVEDYPTKKKLNIVVYDDFAQLSDKELDDLKPFLNKISLFKNGGSTVCHLDLDKEDNTLFIDLSYSRIENFEVSITNKID